MCRNHFQLYTECIIIDLDISGNAWFLQMPATDTVFAKVAGWIFWSLLTIFELNRKELNLGVPLLQGCQTDSPWAMPHEAPLFNKCATKLSFFTTQYLVKQQLKKFATNAGTQICHCRHTSEHILKLYVFVCKNTNLTTLSFIIDTQGRARL